MDFLLKWLLLASVQMTATLSPGPAFAMCVKNSLAHGRRAGVFTSFGLGLGVLPHLIFVLGGMSVILLKSVFFFNVIKYAGAAYLIYIGTKALFFTQKTSKDSMRVDEQTIKKCSDFKFIQNGFLTNFLNPKALVFFTAVYVQFVDIHTTPFTLLLYGLTSVAIEILWFSALSMFLTTPQMKKKFMSISHWVERICGGLLLALGIKLFAMKSH